MIGRETATGVLEFWINAREKSWDVMILGLGMLSEEGNRLSVL